MKKQAFNPYLPSFEYVPDGEPRVFGDRVYVYGSHDAFDGEGFCVNDYVCWSAPVDDLGSWRYEGVIYPAARDPMNADGRMKLFAPDAVQGSDGRYYLYYVFNASSIVGVAVCDTPAGDYQFYGYVHRPDGVPSGTENWDVRHFDPGVLVDDDGRVFLYTGFTPGPGELYEILKEHNQRMEGGYCLELEGDMLTVKSEPVMVIPSYWTSAGTGFEGHEFYEASSIRKVNGKYYLVYSSILSHELCYAVSDYPDRDYRYGGTLVSIGDLGLNGNREALNYLGNTHGGMVEIGGQWYIFYHRQTNKQSCARQGCAEPITIAPDGSIAQAEITSCGLNGGPLKDEGRYNAAYCCHLTGDHIYKGKMDVRTRRTHTDTHIWEETNPVDERWSVHYIANIQPCTEVGFKYFDFTGQTKLTVYARGDARGELLVSTARNGVPVAVIPIAPAKTWTPFEAEFLPLSGNHPLYFAYRGTGAMDFDRFTIS